MLRSLGKTLNHTLKTQALWIIKVHFQVRPTPCVCVCVFFKSPHDQYDIIVHKNPETEILLSVLVQNNTKLHCCNNLITEKINIIQCLDYMKGF